MRDGIGDAAPLTGRDAWNGQAVRASSQQHSNQKERMMHTRTRMNCLRASMALALALIPVLCFGFGAGFEGNPLPLGSHATGPAVKGTLTYTLVNGTQLLATLDAICADATVHVGPLDVTAFSVPSAFPTATGKQIENFVEGLFFDVNAFGVGALDPIQNNCYSKVIPFLGVVITAVNKTVVKTTTLWVGEVTIQGVTR